MISCADTQAYGAVDRHVTAIFSILMRLRQAVLHPSLVLKRLSSNLEANKGKDRTEEEEAADIDDEAIKKMITDYATAGGAFAKSALDDILQGDEEDVIEFVGQCMICLDVSRCDWA